MSVGGVGNKVAGRTPDIEAERKEQVARTKGEKADAKPSADPEKLYPPDRKGQFGVFAAETSTSLDAQYEAAVGEAQGQRQAMLNLSRAAAAAHRGIPDLSRFAEVSVGAGSSLNTLPNLLGGAAQSILSWDAKHLGQAANDAQSAVGFVLGEQTEKIEQAKTLYRQFSNQMNAYLDANQKYQSALRNRDYKAIPTLRNETQRLATEAQNTARLLGSAVKRAAEGDEQFERGAVQAAVHLAATAAGAGALMVGPVAENAHAVKHMAVEVGVVQVGERVHHGVAHE